MQAMQNAGHMENFVLEEIPLKIPLVDPHPDEETQVIMYHSEAQFMLRKHLIEVAKKHWP
jgi:hypothetical protein